MEPITVRPKASPKDVFLHLGSTLALYASAGSFIALMHQFIKRYIADPVSPSHEINWNRSEIVFLLSMLVVAFPTLCALTRVINRGIWSARTKLHIPIRRWLTSFTLFICGATVLAQIIRIIYNWMDGKLTLTILLEILTLFCVASVTFLYYSLDLRREDPHTLMGMRLAGAVSSVVMIAAVIAGFVVAGSPRLARMQKADDVRAIHLENLQIAVSGFYHLEKHLPDTLKEIPHFTQKDPKSGAPYEYRKTGNLSFDVCADFETETIPPTQARIASDSPMNHGIGRTCFPFTVTEEPSSK